MTDRMQKQSCRGPLRNDAAPNARPLRYPLPARLVALLLCAMLVAAPCLAGCGRESSDAVPHGRTVTDCAGRSVAIPDQVNSVACLYAYAGHVCVLLDCDDKIAAVVQGLKRDILMQRKVEGLVDLPSPYAKGAINIEELAAVSPDLVFVRSDILQSAGELQKLDEIGIPYVVVDYTTADDQVISIETMGACLGREDRAQEYAEYYRSTFGLVRDRIDAVPEDERKTVFHSVNEAVRTDIPGTLSYEVLEAAGCKNVVSSSSELQLDGDKGNATVEQIYVWDPDVLLVNEPAATEYFKSDDKFSGLRAVREGSVFQLPVGISRWAHPGSLESPLAALYIAKLLYPDRFQDVDIVRETKDYYDRFFGIDLSDADVEAIFSGVGMRTAREGGAL